MNDERSRHSEAIEEDDGVVVALMRRSATKLTRAPIMLGFPRERRRQRQRERERESSRSYLIARKQPPRKRRLVDPSIHRSRDRAEARNTRTSRQISTGERDESLRRRLTSVAGNGGNASPRDRRISAERISARTIDAGPRRVPAVCIFPRHCPDIGTWSHCWRACARAGQ